MTQINIFEAKTNLSKIAKSLETGEEDYVIIARNGKPLLRLTLEKDNGFKLGTAEGKIDIPDNFDDIDITDDFDEELFPQ